MAATGAIMGALAAQAMRQQQMAASKLKPSAVKCSYCGNVQAVKDQCYSCGANLPRPR